jgi:hypothetical protein
MKQYIGGAKVNQSNSLSDLKCASFENVETRCGQCCLTCKDLPNCSREWNAGNYGRARDCGWCPAVYDYVKIYGVPRN